MNSQAARIANTYTPGIAAAIERGDEGGALTLYHMAIEHMCTELGMSLERSKVVLFWSMTGVATAMLRRAAGDGSPAELVAEVTLRQHAIRDNSHE